MAKVFNLLWYKVLSTQTSHFQVTNCDRQLETKNLLVLYKEKKRKMPIKSVKMEISKTKKCVFFSCPKDHSTQKLGSQVKRCVLQPADRQTDGKIYQCYIRKKSRNVYKKNVKMENSKNKKKCFFLMSQGSLNPKIRFLDQTVCPVAREQTDRRNKFASVI